MDELDRIIVILHIVAGGALVFFSGTMQWIVGPVVGTIPPSERSAGQAIIRRRAEPLMKIAILIQTASALYLLVTRWGWIVSDFALAIKVLAGGGALLLANLLHFVVRQFKMKLAASGESARLNRLNRRVRVLEKLVLTGGAVAFLTGVILNHSR